MGVRNKKRETLRRLDSKTLDARFLNEIRKPAGKTVVDCDKQSVCLTIHRGSEDDRILQEQGTAGFRQARILDLCQEALSQGALLTREDLAYRVFFVSPRTITRDLNVLREINTDVVCPQLLGR